MSDGFAGKACVMTGAGGGMGLVIARACSAPGAALSPPSTPSPSRRNSPKARAPPGATCRATPPTRRWLRAPSAEAFDASAAARLPGQCRRRRLVRPGRLHRRHGDGDLAPGDGDQPHRVRAHGAPCRALPAGAPARADRWSTSRASWGCATWRTSWWTGRSTPTRRRRPGLSALSRSLSMQLGSDGIRSNTICPGAVLTPMTAPGYEADPSRADAMIARTPLGPPGPAGGTSPTPACSCSRTRASFITGIDPRGRRRDHGHCSREASSGVTGRGPRNRRPLRIAPAMPKQT